MDEKLKVFWKTGGTVLCVWLALTLLAVFAEGWIGSRALIVGYKGKLYSPVLQGSFSGKTFDLDYDYEADYRQLAQKAQGKDFVWMPLIPYSPLENALKTHSPDRWAPSPPEWKYKHLLGTDPLGRDILARLVYGYRNALIFSTLYLLGLFTLGTIAGLAMGYWGGSLDFWGQRLIEVWSNIPFIYIVMIVASIITPNLGWLVVLTLAFSWTGLASYVRTLAFRERTREFVLASRVAGAGSLRLLWNHILPQMGTLLLTFMPFQAIGAITTLTSLDFLGFGLRAPTPSWGELLRVGSSSLQAPWIVCSVVVAMTLILILLTLIGNALREAFDPKSLIRYK